jgi:hypothetical protein
VPNRKPRVENKYGLTYDDIEKLKVLKPEYLNEEHFWRNDGIKAWCLSGSTATNGRCVSYDTFWLGIYDKDAPKNAGKIKFYCTSYGDYYSYTFDKFYGENDMENETDFRLHELILEKINYLLNIGILGLSE